MTWSYTDGTNWGTKVNWVGQGGIVGGEHRWERLYGKERLHGKERPMERLIGKTL
jgi:hypothetical protein